MTDLEEKERIEFMQKRIDFVIIYNKFDSWLKSIGFSTTGNHIGTFDLYKEHIQKDYSGVELFNSSIFKEKFIMFIRDNNEHKFFMIDDNFGIENDSTFKNYKRTYSLPEFKELITSLVKSERDNELKKLKIFDNI